VNTVYQAAPSDNSGVSGALSWSEKLAAKVKALSGLGYTNTNGNGGGSVDMAHNDASPYKYGGSSYNNFQQLRP
jgi:hypothetical protein